MWSVHPEYKEREKEKEGKKNKRTKKEKEKKKKKEKKIVIKGNEFFAAKLKII